MQIVVVTKVPDAKAGETGNMATAGLDLYWQTDEQVRPWVYKVRPWLDQLAEDLGDPQKALAILLNLRQPVFELGEILILNEGGREAGYPGRKPDKWDVEVTEVSSLEEAAALARQVMYS